jgi:hypothetical protein
MISLHDDPRIPVRIDVIGAGRGSEQMQPLVARLNDVSTVLRLDQRFVDPDPGKAVTLAERGRRLGLRTSYRETTGEAYLEQSHGDRSPAVVAIDDPRAIARILELGIERVLFIYLLIHPPFGGLTGWRFVLPPENAELKRRLADFFQKLAEVTAPGSSRDVFEPPVNHLTEDLHRKSFAEHFEQNIAKVVNGLEPETAPAEVTFDGREISQVEILESQQRWRTSEELLRDLQSSLQVPVRRGTNFAILEIGENGIRIHQARYRVRDGRFALNRLTATEPESVQRAEVNRLNAALLAD